MKKFLKILISLALIALIALAIQFGKVLSDNNALEDSNDILSARLDSISDRIDFYTRLASVDELFIKGDHDAAMQAYNDIPELSNDPEFMKIRNMSRQNTVQLMEQLKAKDLDGYNKLTAIRLSIDTELNHTQKTYESKIDSLRRRMSIEMNELKTNLVQAEALAEQKPEILELTFFSKIGTKTTYLGEVMNGKANGRGMGHYSTGNMYIGPWKENLRHGKAGEFKWLSGERYVGDYERDKRSGKGIYYFTNGDRYDGEWADDKQNGQGILYDKDNRIKLKGQWRNGELVSTNKSQ